MPTLADHHATRSAQVDRVHAERVRIVPQLRGNYGAGVDPDRSPVETVGPLRVGAAENDAGGARRNFISNIATGKAELHLERSNLPPGFEAKKGDLVIALDRPGQPRFEVERPERDHIARLVLKLSAIGPA
jgi:hypothetical protein